MTGGESKNGIQLSWGVQNQRSLLEAALLPGRPINSPRVPILEALPNPGVQGFLSHFGMALEFRGLTKAS